MLLEAGLLAVFFAPKGLRPRIAVKSCPSRFARFMLIWEWFRISLRVRRRQVGERRHPMAKSHRSRSLLRKWAAADLDWLVRAALAARVSRTHGGNYSAD